MRRSLVQKSPSLKPPVFSSIQRLTAVMALLAVSSYVVLRIAQADTTPQTLPFTQNWSNIGLITADNEWSGVPGVIGYRGDDLTTATGTNPQTIVADGSGTPANVEANETNPNMFATGGVAEFHITDPTIALNGSGTADAPHIVITLNTMGQSNVNVAYNLRDLDGSGDNAIMPVALQFRVGTTGNYTDVPAGFVADATTGPNLATLVTPVSVTLPAAVNNQPVVQVRVITTNAAGNDEWVGVDDINITGTPLDPTPILSVNDVSVTEGDSGAVAANFTVSLSSPAQAGGVTFDIATQDNVATTADNDYVAKSLTGQTIPQGQQTYSFSVMVNGDANVEPDETFFVNVANVTGANVADGQGAGAIVTDDFAITLIHDIQGNAETPNFVGQVKAIRGVVVGDFQGSANLNGFFVQEEDADADADPATSEGIFIFDPATLTPVNVGDNVTITGAVTNFGSPLGLTELITLTSVVVNSSGNPLPVASVVSLPAPVSPAADLERFEGMRVMFDQTLFVTGNDDLGQFGELVLSANSPLFIPTNSVDPNDDPASGTSISGNSNVAAVTARQRLNNNSRIILNDAKTGSNPNPIPFIGAGTNATVRRGDSVANLAGILSFGFGGYRIEPTALPLSFTASNPRPAAPASIGGALRVASFNITNYFVDPPDPTGRGAGGAAEFMRQRDKAVAALAGLNADVIGLIELEKGTQATADAAANSLVTALNALGTVGTYAVVPTPAAVYDPMNPVGTDAEIKSGIIYRASTVTPVGNSLTDTAAAAGTYSRAPIAQTFQRNSTSDKFTVVVNHFRSKSCAGASGADADQGDGQSCFNDRRRGQSQALLAFVDHRLIPVDPDVVVVGDLNSYGQEDPIDVFRAAGYIDALAQFVPATSQYTFTFNSEAGRLDHAFAT
ncbi:MAG TPA: ExeM/NucH family extracellular endonuclease, partial [Blastocatellia bacterium]|nr:ExeM/NucH family extracellular endonuclease [Blastocatellia bacterium]